MTKIANAAQVAASTNGLVSIARPLVEAIASNVTAAMAMLRPARSWTWRSPGL